MQTLEERDGDNFIVEYRGKKVFITRDRNPNGYWEGFYQNKGQPECIRGACYMTLSDLLDTLAINDEILSKQRPKIKYKKVRN